MSSAIIWLVPLTGLLGFATVGLLLWRIMRKPVDHPVVEAIGGRIYQGAMAFMKREMLILAIFTIVVGVLVTIFLDPLEGVTFFLGALCSFGVGWIGMYTATHANMRTTMAADREGEASALRVAFVGGSVMGLSVASTAILGIGLLFIWLGRGEHAHAIHGFAMGASLVAVFFRVGGGIFTKAADVGADLVGKVESGIPEDDPRNAAVIADNVGDNVGDVAGMGSDLFESFCNSQIATIAIAATMGLAARQQLLGEQADSGFALMALPLLLAALGLLCALGGIGLVLVFANRHPAKALRVGTIGATLIFVLTSGGLIHWVEISPRVWFALLGGAIGGVLIGLSTEYFTGGPPVRHIARSGRTGTATVMITGLATGLLSVVYPMLIVAGAIFLANSQAGLFGVGIAAVGMLATIGITMAIDAYGPIADNAGGIAQMAGLEHTTRDITDRLDAVGNTTAAIGKGFAIGAAGLAAISLIAAYVNVISQKYPDFSISVSDPTVMIGILLGGICPFLNGAITMTAVGDAAYEMIEEVRRQFHDIPGLMEGTAEPDSARCVDIATASALKKMILPALLAIGAPVVVGFVLGPETLGGLLVGALLGCMLLAIFMSNAGGAWDNAKKYIESGHFGGKNSAVHKACVVGDTVGDPLKDTSGPSMNILINVMAIVSLVIAPLL